MNKVSCLVDLIFWSSSTTTCLSVLVSRIHLCLALLSISGKALEEKRRICQHFVIQLDNPTTILQQEEAKVFFTNNSDAKRYEFFFKATTLHA